VIKQFFPTKTCQIFISHYIKHKELYCVYYARSVFIILNNYKTGF